MARRKSPAAVGAAGGRIEVTPRDRSGPLPAWSPLTPAGGWTVPAAVDAAFDYAPLAAPSAPHASDRALVSAAYRALLRAQPGLVRAELEERLRGVDHFRAALDSALPRTR